MAYDDMTDEEYEALKAAKPKPCPFCGKEMIFTDDHHGAFYEHPGNDCYESAAQLYDVGDVKRWNRRPNPEENQMDNHVNRLVTVLYGDRLLKCALQVPDGILSQECVDYPMAPKSREAIRALLPLHVRNCGPVVNVEPLFEIHVIADNAELP